MRVRPFRAALAATGSVLATSLLVAGLAAPLPALAEDYPSWAEVEAAKSDASARAAEVERLEGLLGGLQQRAATLGDAAVEAAARSAEAEAAHARSSARADALTAEADAAAERASADRVQLGAVAAQLSRSGGGADVGMRLLFGGGDERDLLQALSAANRLTGVYGGLAEQAEANAASAASLQDQARVADDERRRLAAAAEAAADAARDAHASAEAELAATRAQSETLVAQLASLRDRSVELERRYQAGVDAAAEAAARERAAREQAERDAAAPQPGPAPGGGSGDTAPPPGIVVDPDGARAYAASAIGAYGWGDGEFNCLVLLWNRESGWRADAYNASSGAYGIPQSLPGSKMEAAGPDWRTNAATQINWGLMYISGRYGTPCAAWAHSEMVNWY